MASSAPATSAQLIDDDDSGLICCGFVFGISFSVRQMKTTSRNMKMIGAQVMISGSRLLQLYQCGSATAGVGGADDLDRLEGTPVGAVEHAAQYARRHGAGD